MTAKDLIYRCLSYIAGSKSVLWTVGMSGRAVGLARRLGQSKTIKPAPQESSHRKKS